MRAFVSMQRPAIADYPAGARLATRVLDDYELVWMLRGQATLRTDDNALELRPGLVLLIPPGVRHGFEWDIRRPCRHGYVHFGRADAGIPLPRSVHFRRMTAHDPLAGLCSHLLWLGREPATERARPTLRFLLALLTSGPLPADRPATALADPLWAIVSHLRKEWAKSPLRRIGIAELASVATVSRGHLSRLFHAQLGIGAAACLELLRGYQAEILLTRTDFPVSSIAGQCGFADVYHFSHRFTRLYGMSPSAYRASGGPAPSALDHPGVRRLASELWES
jgi:AraC family transcriptional regulator